MSTAFPQTNAGCCSSQADAPGVPAAISNPPGLNAVQHRIGDFTSFRAAMLAAVPAPDLLAGGATSLQIPVGNSDTVISINDASLFPATVPFRIKIDDEYLSVTSYLSPTSWSVVRGVAPASHGLDSLVVLVPANPFAGWHPGINGDYQTILIELWAYVADVLTFYQERIANEAYLGTATLRDSLLRLAALVDYRPGPGAGSGGWVGFTVAPGQPVTVPAGFRVGSRSRPGQPQVVFETGTPVAAVADNNSIPLALLSPLIPFAPTTVVVKGTNSGVTTGDHLLVIENGKPHLLRVTGVAANSALGATLITWEDPLGICTQVSKRATVYAFGVSATPFGYNAPLWDVLSPTITNSNSQFPTAIYPVSWEIRSFERPAALNVAGAAFLERFANEWFFIPVPTERTDQLFLDRAYSELKYNSSNPGIAVLLNDEGVFQILKVIDTAETAKTAYGVAAQSTRLTFDQPITPKTFPLRSTVVLTGIQVLPLQVDLPVPDPLTGASPVLAGIHTQLQDGQTVVLRGNLFDAASASASSTVAGETAVLDGVPQPDTANGVTLVNLKQGLANQYAHATCVLLGNVATVTQGETVGNEILGNGDASAFQSLPLKKKPLTYLPSTDPEGLSAVQTTLTVSVNNVAWTEEPNLATSAPADQAYITSLDDSGQTTVIFGDGFNGARPATGVNNIQAHYRKGLGSAGNLAIGGVQQLVDSLPNLQKVTNPIPTTGGADPENPASIRKNAPGALQTFGRAVSGADYAALAASYPGVAKASAAWIVQDAVTGQVVAHPYVQLTAATSNRVPLQGTTLAANLRRFLDRHRDPNVLLRIQDFTPVYIAVTVEIAINPKFPSQATLNAVNAALNPGVNSDGSLGFFAFDRLQFGETIFLSALYAAIQAVPGIDSAVVTKLARVAPAPADPASAAPHDIPIRPTEVAVIDGDANSASVLTVIGKGGFAGS